MKFTRAFSSLLPTPKRDLNKVKLIEAEVLVEVDEEEGDPDEKKERSPCARSPSVPLKLLLIRMLNAVLLLRVTIEGEGAGVRDCAEMPGVAEEDIANEEPVFGVKEVMLVHALRETDASVDIMAL